MTVIKTNLLQTLVMKASKGASNNKMLPLTSMMSIVVKEVSLDKSRVCLCTTDASNYLYVTDIIEHTDDLSVVVPQEQFSKLVSKLTTENVSLELTEHKLIVKGNGTYNIELPLNENGELVVFPSPLSNIDMSKGNTFDVSLIKSILTHNKPALAKDKSIPCYAGYYMDKDEVITTDIYTMCSNNVKLFDAPVLLSMELVDLLDTFDEPQIKLVDTGDNLVFISDKCIVYGAKMKEINDFQIDALKGLITQDFESVVKINRQSLISVLDRLSLFVGRYDKNMISLDFTNKGLLIKSKASSGAEVIEYEEAKNFKEFKCYIDIELFLAQLKAQENDIIDLWFGKDNAIKMVDKESIIHIIALGDND